MSQLHSLLKEQLRKYFGKSFSIPKKWKPFIEAVNKVYMGSGLENGADIEKRKKLHDQLQHERELISNLASLSNISEALEVILDSALQIEGIDSGGIYIIDKKTGELNLISHRGLSSKFIQSVSYYDAKSARAKLVMGGEPVYTGYSELCKNILGDVNVQEQDEGLHAMAVIPVKYQDKVVACLNLASHDCDDIPIDTRYVLETFAALIGGAIARMEAEESRRDFEDRYKKLFEEARDAIFIADVETGILLEVNKAAEKLLNKTRDEIVGMHQSDLHPPEDIEEYKELFEAHVSAGGSPTIEAEVIDSQGRRIPVEICAVVTTLKDGSQVIRGSFRDITRRRKAERELQHAKASLEQWSLKLAQRVQEKSEELEQSREELARHEKLSAIGQMAASLSHELKTPVTVIKNSLYYLKQQKTLKQDPKTLSYLALVEKQIDSCVQIMNNVLDFAKPKKINVAKMSLKELVEDSLSVMDIPSNIEVNATYQKGVFEIEADPLQIKQVFMNLIKNAINAMPKGGFLTISASKRANDLIIEFKDTGNGIPKESLSKIFDPLFSTFPDGTGLGLSVSQQIIGAHGGRIEVESELGKGATFIVKLPIKTGN